MVDYKLNNAGIAKLVDKFGVPLACTNYYPTPPAGNYFWDLLLPSKGKYAKVELYHRTTTTATFSTHPDYKMLDVGTVDNYMLEDLTNWFTYLRKTDYPNCALPTDAEGYDTKTTTPTVYTRFWFVPKWSTFTATKLQNQIKYIATNGVSGSNYPSEAQKRHRVPHQYFNDLMNYRQPFGPTRRKK